MVDIKIRTINDVYILDCKGKLILGEGTAALRNAVREILRDGGKKVIVNLAEVNYIDNCGIGELVSSYTTIMERGGRLGLLNLTKKIRELLEITKLLKIFELYENEQFVE